MTYKITDVERIDSLIAKYTNEQLGKMMRKILTHDFGGGARVQFIFASPEELNSNQLLENFFENDLRTRRLLGDKQRE